MTLTDDQKAHDCAEAFRPFADLNKLKPMELPEHLHQYAAENIAIEGRAASIKALWATNLGLVPVKEGDQWMVLYGENIQVGIAAFGASPEAAMYAFEEEMQSKSHKDSLSQWRPIASAPRDGTDIFTFPHYRVTHWEKDQGGWSSCWNEEADRFDILTGPGPSYWMELPKAPSHQEKE